MLLEELAPWFHMKVALFTFNLARVGKSLL